MISRSDFEKICVEKDIDIINSTIRDIEMENSHEVFERYLNRGLEVACRNGRLNVIELLIQKGADDWGKGLEGACQGGHLDIVNLMIKKGVYKWNWGLYGACEGGHLDIINLMIEKGANDLNGGLLRACEGGHLNTINFMIEKCTGIVDMWDWGLYGACRGGNLDIVEMMIEKGANNWDEGLSMACKGGYLNIVKLMIKHGANNWNFALGSACGGKHLNIVKLMFECGANEWGNVFYYIFDMIDSDIINYMIKKEIRIEKHLKYPSNETKIFRLLELGLPINIFKKIQGFDDLTKTIEDRQYVVKEGLSDHLINDLTGIVAEYIID